MTATTITFAVQIGSGGFAIARMVAERLKYGYYDWEVTSQAANEAGVAPDAVAAAEHSPLLLERIAETLLASGAYRAGEPIGKLSSVTMATAIRSLSSRGYRNFIEQVVSKLADRGEAMIVGHAGQIVLRSRRDVFKVLVWGSPQVRAERLAVEEQRTFEASLAAVRESDADRIAFFKQTYAVDLLSATLYDLTLNTDFLTLDSAADLVELVAKQRLS